jgi:diguanylate cyclase (GGDEF)-like protein
MDITLPGIPVTLALAVVAALGYLFGRRTHTQQEAPTSGARREVRRAVNVARELETIAEQLRKSLASHHGSVARFRERVANLGQEQSDAAWAELCQEAEQVLKPTMRLATQIAQAYDEIRQQSNHLMTFTEIRTDSLTGVSNRRALDESLDMMFAVMARYDQSFSLAIFDIDHFKQINDQHGHLFGDGKLRDVARLIDDSVRETDVVTRYGGEEFVVIMPHTNLEGAVIFSERLRGTIEKTMKLTVSGGVAQAADGDNPQTLLARADAAMYGAKAGGRNRVYFHTGESIAQVTPEDAVAATQ